MISQIREAIRVVAEEEVMTRFMRHEYVRKADGSLRTPADVEAQKKLRSLLCDIKPAPFLGEEMTENEQKKIMQNKENFLWCVDPLDGTSNFVNGIPFFAISVALLEKGQSCVGVVYDPVGGEMFHAEKGGGAYLNESIIKRKVPPRALSQAIAQIDFKRLPKLISSSLLKNPPFASQRNFGASSLEWCYLAKGRFDVYAHGSQKVWDYAAGALILSEAQGVLRTLYSADFWKGPIGSRSVVAASSPSMLDEWVERLRVADPKIPQ